MLLPVAVALLLAGTPISLALSHYANVVHPEDGSPWLLRMATTFMFPK